MACPPKHGEEIYPYSYHAFAAIQAANRSDFFNTRLFTSVIKPNLGTQRMCG
jgi:hypothetical protein